MSLISLAVTLIVIGVTAREINDICYLQFG